MFRCVVMTSCCRSRHPWISLAHHLCAGPCRPWSSHPMAIRWFTRVRPKTPRRCCICVTWTSSRLAAWPALKAPMSLSFHRTEGAWPFSRSTNYASFRSPGAGPERCWLWRTRAMASGGATRISSTPTGKAAKPGSSMSMAHRGHASWKPPSGRTGIPFEWIRPLSRCRTRRASWLPPGPGPG